MTKTKDLCLRLRADLRLTPGEKLWLNRRAKGVHQTEMARLYGVALDRYRAWEEGIGDVPVVRMTLVSLSLGDLCDIHRRRLGLTLRQIAEDLGMGLTWVYKASLGHNGAERVVAYLEEKRDE